jgi:hypothetical protein
MISLEEFKKELNARKKSASTQKEAAQKISIACEKNARHLKKTASKIAMGLAKNGLECVGFLKEHVTRTNSPAARTLLEAIRAASPQISENDFKPSNTSVLDAVKGPQQQPLMAPEVQATIPEVPAAPAAPVALPGAPMAGSPTEKTAEVSSKHAQLTSWACGLKEAELEKLKGVWAALNGETATIEKTAKAQSKWGGKYGMYGFASEAVKASLDACNALRHEAGILASETILTHGDYNAIEACYKSAYEKEASQAADLIACCMPTASWKPKE